MLDRPPPASTSPFHPDDLPSLSYRSIKLPHKSLIIKPISDIHRGSDTHKATLFQRDLRWILETENAYTIINGDLFQGNIKTRKTHEYNSPSILWEKDRLTEDLEPLAKAGKILAMTRGNHDARYDEEVGDDPVWDIACRLQIHDTYMKEEHQVVRIGFYPRALKDADGTDNMRAKYTFFMHHGGGGGTTVGAALGFSQKILEIYPQADCIVIGHWHRRQADVSTMNYAGWPPKPHDVMLFVSGTYEGWARYARAKGYKPLRPGSDFIELGYDKRHDVVLSRAIMGDQF